MTVDEAIEEARRWFAYGDARRAIAVKTQEIAAMMRAGKRKQANQELKHLNSQPIVYDGAKLREAVEVLVARAEAQQAEGRDE